MAKKKNVTTIVSLILDQSGSMSSIQEATIKGVNEYINTLKKDKVGKVLFSLTLFDSDGFNNLRLDKPYRNISIEEVEPLTSKTYSPSGGTPLYDAVIDTIKRTEKIAQKTEGDTAILMVIMTDGEENSSKEHDAQCMRDQIEDCKDGGNWTFVFLGANQDSWATSKHIGVSFGNQANWQPTSLGVQDAFRGLALNSVALSAKASAGEMLNTASFMSLANDTKFGDAK